MPQRKISVVIVAGLVGMSMGLPAQAQKSKQKPEVGAVWASQFAGSASGTAMLILFIMRHYHFAFKSFRQVHRFPVIGVLFCNDFLVMCKIITGAAHADKQ